MYVLSNSVVGGREVVSRDCCVSHFAFVCCAIRRCPAYVTFGLEILVWSRNCLVDVNFKLRGNLERFLGPTSVNTVLLVFAIVADISRETYSRMLRSAVGSTITTAWVTHVGCRQTFCKCAKRFIALITTSDLPPTNRQRVTKPQFFSWPETWQRVTTHFLSLVKPAPTPTKKPLQISSQLKIDVA